ncbi:MAG: tripartite tricarboxylate transporter substrate binding protein [Comamonadaceae bacterium]|nr:tripartite tricarboxylate transporter substrate binding protein [Comamonadaceae bacterium]
MKRRSFLRNTLLLPTLGSTGLASTAVRAQAWPERAITLVVPYPAGGNTDFVARMTADYLGRALGKPVVVDNRAGAGGTIAAALAAKMPADGHSLFLASIAQISLAPFLYKIRYDPIKDFLPVANVAGNPQVLVVPEASPHKTLKQFVDYGLTNKGALSMAHAGTGSMSFLAGAAFLKRAGIEAVMVPYKGGAAAISDTTSGQTDAYTANISEILPHLQGNRLRMLAVTSPQPVAMLPGVPTIASMFPGFQTETWNGLLAPAGVPAPIAERLGALVSKMFSDESVQTRMATAGLIAQTGQQSPKDFGRRIQNDIDLWRPIIKSIDVKPE